MDDRWIRSGRMIAASLVGSLCVACASADDWPQWRGPQRDGVWRETGLIEKFDTPRLKPLWRAPIAGGYSGPTVAEGRVFVSDRVVRPRQIERVHCFDATNGRKLWTHEYECAYRGVQYDAGPRASVTISDGRAYALGAMGDLFCLAAADGHVIWHKDLDREYDVSMPIWGLTSAPLVDGDLVIVQVGGADGACLVAFNKKTGNEQWRALDDRASYTAPIIVRHEGKRVLVCWTGDSVAGLNPQSGDVHWRYPFKPAKIVLAIATPVYDKGRLFVSGFYDGSLMLKLPADGAAVELLWRRKGANERNTEALHSLISTPLLLGDHVYGVDSYGELRCLDAATGERIWESLAATPKARWSTIHMVRNGERVWMFNERGELIISRLSPKGFEEISRAKLIEPTTDQLGQRGGVCWAHPAFANRRVFARNGKELICASLAAP